MLCAAVQGPRKCWIYDPSAQNHFQQIANSQFGHTTGDLVVTNFNNHPGKAWLIAGSGNLAVEKWNSKKSGDNGKWVCKIGLGPRLLAKETKTFIGH